MQKLYLGISAFYLSIVCGFAQAPSPDSTGFTSRKLKVQEINFVSSYYQQDGDNSAVTGGVGSEKLTDFANVLQVTMLKTDPKNRSHTYGFEFGLDHYSSASSDKINPATITSASYTDNRFYPSASWLMEDKEKQYSIGAGASLSKEYDYFSTGFNVTGSKFNEDRNREISLKLSMYLDTWKVIYPVELREIESPSGLISNPDAHGNKPRNTFNASLIWLQIINMRLQMALTADVAYQSGQLGTLYQRVYFKDGTHTVEKLPESRFKLPMGLRANYFLTDRIVLRSFYRYYYDDWGISANTIEVEGPYKISPFFSLSPFYRFYSQTAADYFAPFQQHQNSDRFYTSDYDLSEFTSHFGGLNLRINSANGIFGINHLNTLEIRYGHYSRSNGLQSNIVTLAATIK